MKAHRNVTVTLPPEIARWARIYAARLGLSTSRMIAELLTSQMKRDDHYDAAMKEFFADPPKQISKQSRRYPTRDELYE